jgi:diaminohydroxyphosphoribosylaminopyrimidine deaminase / 5-amino-6-(5-phosphoribosylamino)uracil reductase
MSSEATFGARDYEWMAQALALAQNGIGNTAPNPTVGCVLVKDGRAIGSGWSAPAGGPHAERVALAAAGPEARGATAYVTLEPCCHHGRTGPCTTALIEAGVAHVIYGARDPNPRVNGGGIRELEAAGIRVAGGILAEASAELNRGFFSRMQRGRPWVRSKLAASLDGRTALASGASRWITGEAARLDVHRWRARSDAILTGSGTVLHDDPALTARPDGVASARQPLRAIVDSALKVPPRARTLAEPGGALVFTCRSDAAAEQALAAAGARIERVGGEGRCDLRSVLVRLAALEINEVWVEAGPGLNGALLGAELIDEVVIYVAPRILGERARAMFNVGELASLDESRTLEFRDVQRLGDDLRIVAEPVYRDR